MTAQGTLEGDPTKLNLAGGTMTGVLELVDGSPAASEQYVQDHAAGGGTVLTVAGVSPGGGGDVPLTAADIDAATTADIDAAIAALMLGTASTHPAADFLAAASNLSDVANAAAARGNLGLGNVNNTSDAAKPVSTATATALAGKADLVGGKVDVSQIPDLAIVQYLGTSANQAAMLALTGQSGDWTIRTDLGSVWIVTGTPTSSLSSWTSLSYPTAPVISVAGRTGAIVLAAADVTGVQPLDTDLTTIAALTPTTDDLLQYKAGAWTHRSIAQLKTDLAYTAADVSAQPVDTDLTAIAGLTATTGNIIQSVSNTWASRTPAQLKATLALVAADLSDFATAVAALAPPTTRAFTTGGLLTGGGDLSADRALNTLGIGPQPDDFGMIDWSFDPQFATSSGSVPTSGTVYGIKFRMRTSKTISTLYLMVGATGTQPSNVVGGLYDATGTQITGATGTIAPATYNATGRQGFTLGTPAAVTAGSWYYGCFFVNGATSPSLIRTNTSGLSFVGQAGLSGTSAASPASALRVFSADTGRTTTLPSSLGTLSSIAMSWWMGIA